MQPVKLDSYPTQIGRPHVAYAGQWCPEVRIKGTCACMRRLPRPGVVVMTGEPGSVVLVVL